jgi:hypothetical protein
VIAYPAAGIAAYRTGVPFGTLGWPAMSQVTAGRLASEG